VKRYLAVMTAVLIVALGTPGRAQEQRPAAPGVIALKVQVVLSRFQGEKKISSLPYTMTVTTTEVNSRNSGRANLRLGSQVPITTMTRQGSDEKAPLVPSVQYRDVGTSIDCIVTVLDDGRFKLELSVEDSSIDTGPAGAGSLHPTFRSFRTSETVLLRDGQSAQYSTATDKVSSDVWKVDVTLNVIK
jgi:hypothetical protein